MMAIAFFPRLVLMKAIKKENKENREKKIIKIVQEAIDTGKIRIKK